MISRYGHPRSWWGCIPVVPSSRTTLDHWAGEPDGRCTPYERLRRVWMDSTRFQSPKHDPDRPHESSNFGHTVRRICGLWELMALFRPSDWYGPLLAAAGFGSDGFCPADCAWAYEYEGMVGVGKAFKQTDVVVHLRDAVGREQLLVIEVKRPGDKLKENCGRPDTLAASYLDLPAFQAVADRKLIYLVDERYAPVVRAKVDTTDPRWGVVTWWTFHALQRRLAESLPTPVRELMILCVDVLAFGVAESERPSVTESGVSELEAAASHTDELPDHLAAFAASAVQFLRVRSGLGVEAPAFRYLDSEPTFAQVHGYDDAQRQRTADRRKALWRLPATSGQLADPRQADALIALPHQRVSTSVGAATTARQEIDIASIPQELPAPSTRTAVDQSPTAADLYGSTGFPKPVGLDSVVGISLAEKVQAVLDRARRSSSAVGGLTIGKRSRPRALCYVGPLPVGVDRDVRAIVGVSGFQVSAVRDPDKIAVYETRLDNTR